MLDGSCVDISPVVRSDYADAQYMEMTVEAVAGWESEYLRYYHQSDIWIIPDESGHSYLIKAMQQVQSQIFDHASRIRVAHLEFTSVTLQNCEGFLTSSAVWADSAEGVRQLALRCATLGVSFVTGTRGSLDSIVLDGTRVVSVNVREGPPLLAVHVCSRCM